MNSPGGTGFAINDVTRDIVYDHVYAVGWEVGIEVPVNGTTTINGGFFNDLNGLLIRTAQSRTRAVNIYSNSDGSAQFGNLSTTALKNRHAVRHQAVSRTSIPPTATSRGCSIPT